MEYRSPLPNKKACCFSIYKLIYKRSCLYIKYINQYIKGGLKGWGGTWGVHALPIFGNHYVFYNHFEETGTLLSEVELIINNASLTQIYPNTAPRRLTPNHLFDRQLFYSSNTTSTVALVNCITTYLWEGWANEYVVNLRETQQTSRLSIER